MAAKLLLRLESTGWLSKHQPDKVPSLLVPGSDPAWVDDHQLLSLGDVVELPDVSQVLVGSQWSSHLQPPLLLRQSSVSTARLGAGKQVGGENHGED